VTRSEVTAELRKLMTIVRMGTMLVKNGDIEGSYSNFLSAYFHTGILIGAAYHTAQPDHRRCMDTLRVSLAHILKSN